MGLYRAPSKQWSYNALGDPLADAFAAGSPVRFRRWSRCLGAACDVAGRVTDAPPELARFPPRWIRPD